MVRTVVEWQAILRTDPDFERLVKTSGVIRRYHKGFNNTQISNPARRAVDTFLYTDAILGDYLHLVIVRYQSSTHNLRSALLLWFAENWDRWMRETDSDRIGH